MNHSPRIVILGGGVAGIDLATRLGRRHGRRGRADITLVDRSLSHVWKPMLHTFAAGTARPDRQQVSFLAQAEANGFRFRAARFEGVDRDAREAILRPLGGREAEGGAPPERLGYDRLVVALGSRANDFGTPGVAEHCLSIDDLVEALACHARLREHALAALRGRGGLDVAIVGGGATGVELAAELKRAVDLLAGYGSPSLPERFRLALIESGPRLLPAFPEHVSRAADATLSELGIQVRTGTRVTAADAAGFALADGSRIDAAVRVWAAGVKAPDALDGIEGLERAKAGQLIVTERLRTTRDPGILALGDCAALTDPGTGRPVPATAQAAGQQAAYLGSTFAAWSGGAREGSDEGEREEEAAPFRYRERGAIVSLADFNGWGTLGCYTFGGGRLKGVSARFAHALLYRRHQFALLGPARGALACLVDGLDRLLSPPVRLD